MATIGKILIALILFGTTMVCWNIWVSDISSRNYYDVELGGNYSGYFEELNRTLNETQRISREISGDVESGEDITSKPSEETGEITWTSLIRAAYGSMRLVTGSFKTVSYAVSGFFGFEKAGAWFGGIILTIFILVISFLILSAVFRWRLF